MEVGERIRHYDKRQIATYELVGALEARLKIEYGKSYHRILINAGRRDTRQHKNFIRIFAYSIYLSNASLRYQISLQPLMD